MGVARVLLVAVLVGGALLVVRRSRGTGTSAARPAVRLVATTRLSRSSSVSVVRVAGRDLVLGVSEGRVTLLTETPPEALAAPAAGTADASGASAGTATAPGATAGTGAATPAPPTAGATAGPVDFAAVLAAARARLARRAVPAAAGPPAAGAGHPGPAHGDGAHDRGAPEDPAQDEAGHPEADDVHVPAPAAAAPDVPSQTLVVRLPAAAGPDDLPLPPLPRTPRSGALLDDAVEHLLRDAAAAGPGDGRPGVAPSPGLAPLARRRRGDRPPAGPRPDAPTRRDADVDLPLQRTDAPAPAEPSCSPVP